MKRRFRGDAPAVAQITRLNSQASGVITLVINGKIGVAVDTWNAAAIASAWNASTLPELAEVTASVDGDDVLLTADVAGVPFEVRGLVNGEPLADDEQLVAINPAGAGGTFPLTFDGQTTAAIGAGAAASAVQTSLEGLPNLAPGDVVVTGPPGGPWRVRFTGARADVDQPELLTDRTNLTGGDAAVTISTIQQGNSGAVSPLLVQQQQAGVAGTNERQRFRYTADPGALSGLMLRWYRTAGPSTGYASTAFPANASLATMQAALEAMNAGPVTKVGVGNVSLSGTLANSWSSPTNGIVLEFVGERASAPQPQYQLVNAVNGFTVMACTTIAEGVAGTNEIQTLQLQAAAVGDGYRLRLGDHLTEQILWTATAGEIRKALDLALGSGSVGLPTDQPVDETLYSTYGGDGILAFEFSGPGYQSVDLPLLEVLGVGAEEIQEIAISPDAWKGTVTLTLGPHTAAAATWNETAASLQPKLAALPNVGAGKVTCFGGPWPVRSIVAVFNATLDNLPQMTAVHTLTNASIGVATLQEGGAAIATTEQRRSRGPKHWDDPLNWADDTGAAGVPGAGDVVHLELPRAELLYGIRQRSEFVADVAGDALLLATGRETFWNGQRLVVRTSGVLPGGLSAATTYYAVNVSGDRLQLSLTANGDPVAIADAGTGTHEVGVLLTELLIDSRFASLLGLPRQNVRGYDEYRPQKLELWATSIEIGAGSGNGSPRLKLSTGTQPTSIEVLLTGSGTEAGVPALLWDGDHVDNLLEVVDGDVGIALFPEDRASFGKLTERGGSVIIGRDVDVGGIRRTGGELVILGADIVGEAFL